MSSKANAIRYSGNPNALAGGPSLMQIIAAASGYDDVTGGPQLITLPDGTQKWTYVEAQPKKQGFLSKWGQGPNRAKAINESIGGSAYLQQEGSQQAKELELERRRTQKQVEKTRGKEQRKGTETAGTQNRLTQEQFANLTRETERLRAQLAENEAMLKTALEGAGKVGVIPRSKQDLDVAAAALNDPLIRRALVESSLATEQANQQGRILASPRGQAANEQSMMALMQSPIINNLAKARFNVAPANIAQDYNVNASGQVDLNTPRRVIGAMPTRSQQVISTPRSFEGQELPPEINTINKESYEIPVDQNILQRAAALDFSKGVNTPDNTQVTDVEELKRQIEQMRQLMSHPWFNQ